MLDSHSVRGLLVLRSGEGYATLPGRVAASGELLLARGGQIRPIAIEEQYRIDPSDWLDTRCLIVKRALAPAPAVTAKLEPPASLGDARAILADIPPIDEAARRFTEPVRREDSADGAPAVPFEPVVAVAKRIAQWFYRSGDGAGRGSAVGTSPPPLSLRRIRLAEWLRQSRLGRLIGRRQARYISRLLRVLDDGDIDAALRHSIPLGGDDDHWRGYSWGLPAPRSGEQIMPSVASGFHTLLIGGESLHDMLQQRYRNLATRLERRQQIDRAAFVLAELLSAPTEAVSLLERYGKLREAAEIAELKQLQAGLVIRQWFIAGDTERALSIARRSGRFADAIARVESSHPERASELREAWAAHLAQAGDYAGAVDVLWPAPALRPTALQWIDTCMAAGGAPAARMLVMRLQLQAQDITETCEQVLQWLACDEDAANGRTALLQALSDTAIADQAYTALSPWLGSILRSTLRDYGGGVGQAIAHHKLEQIARRGDQRALLADWPRQLRRPGEQTPEWRIDVSDTGMRPVFDFALLPNGRSLYAMGEAGVELRKRQRVIKRFEAPAERLVLSDNGARAIALAPRDQRTRATLLHLDSVRAIDLGDIELSHYCDTYDGSEWFITQDRQVLALAVGAASLKVSWQAADLGQHSIQGIARHATSLWLLIADHELQVWRYEVPAMLLRARDTLQLSPNCERVTMLSYGDLLAAVTAEQSGAQQPRAHTSRTLLQRASNTRQWRELPVQMPHSVAVCGQTLAIVTEVAEGFCVRGSDEAGVREKFKLVLHGSRDLNLRAYNQSFHFCDSMGRCVAIDPKTGRILQNLRG